MALPVTGPHITEIGATGTPLPSTYVYKNGSKQARPFNAPLGYHARRGTVTTRKGSGNNEGGMTIGAWDHWLYIPQNLFQATVSKSYDRLKDKMYDQASLGVALAEVGTSLSMIRNRAVQLYQFTRRLRKGDLVGAASTLRTPVPKKASVKRNFADNYLEFHFGWSPLIGDIYSAIDVLQSPLKAHFARAGAKTGPVRVDLSLPVDTSNPSAVYPAYNTQKAYRYWKLDVRVDQGVEMEVSNPNLWLANQLGLVNPALIVYELVPFSFVANWFFNVEQFLTLGTDFYGLTLKNAWSTISSKGSHHDYHHRTYRWWENGKWVYGGGLVKETVGTFSSMKRSTGLLQPEFFVRPAKAWKWRRTAAAVSLLVQKLRI